MVAGVHRVDGTACDQARRCDVLRPHLGGDFRAAEARATLCEEGGRRGPHERVGVEAPRVRREGDCVHRAGVLCLFRQM
jgi:hypothetical protein